MSSWTIRSGANNNPRAPRRPAGALFVFGAFHVPMRFRRPQSPLSSQQLSDIVARRDAGETWMSIGRDLGKQDGVLKRAYQAAKAALVPAPLAV